MNVIYTIVGCLIGVIFFELISLVVPMKSFGDYSTGILVAFCFFGCAFAGGLPGWIASWRKP